MGLSKHFPGCPKVSVKSKIFCKQICKTVHKIYTEYYFLEKKALYNIDINY